MHVFQVELSSGSHSKVMDLNQEMSLGKCHKFCEFIINGGSLCPFQAFTYSRIVCNVVAMDARHFKPAGTPAQHTYQNINRER